MGNNTENKIKEAEIKDWENNLDKSKVSVIKKNSKKKKRWDIYIELILFFILGFLLGVSIKKEAAKKITIGYNDYKMHIQKQDYDLNQLQKDLIQKQAETQQKQIDKTKKSTTFSK